IYEQPLSDLITYYETLTREERVALMSSIIGNDDSIYLAVSLYAYFMRTKCEGKIEFTASQIKQIITELAEIVKGAGQITDAGINAATIAKASVLLASCLILDADTVKEFAAGYLSDVLKESMTASGATQEELDSVTNTDACLSLTHILSHLFFGNIWQSDAVRPLNPNNEQIRSAATLIGNAANLVVDHANEIIIAWLKTEDHYYDVYTNLTEAQQTGYRRVYVNTSGDIAFNGNITDANGNVIALVENGVVKNSTDKWIGFTNTDDGGFFRIPADQDILIRLNTVKNAAVSVNIGEYELYDAKTTMHLDKTVNARATDTVIISLPALSMNEMPSDTEYTVTVTPGGEDSNILGDADMDGTVDMIDVTWIQRHIAELITLSENALVLSDVDKDSSVTVLDVTAIQRYESMLKAPEGIGQPIN
ncbi:dockerin type I repeat-containing protein, partial [Ruminococcus sp.]|uniref:dockerin type I repeat-containing protein n=1 Tax=Ruminococcus sp. TaxID=41978 RepID=UPI003866BE35